MFKIWLQDIEADSHRINEIQTDRINELWS